VCYILSSTILVCGGTPNEVGLTSTLAASGRQKCRCPNNLVTNKPAKLKIFRIVCMDSSFCYRPIVDFTTLTFESLV
jgi:hypothetical protein